MPPTAYPYRGFPPFFRDSLAAAFLKYITFALIRQYFFTPIRYNSQ